MTSRPADGLATVASRRAVGLVTVASLLVTGAEAAFLYPLTGPLHPQRARTTAQPK